MPDPGESRPRRRRTGGGSPRSALSTVGWPPTEAIYRKLFESARHAIVVFDGAGRVLMLNPTAEKHLAVAPPDAIGRPAAEVFPMFGEAEQAQVQRVLDSGRSVKIEARVQLAGGSRTLLGVIEAICDDDGRPCAAQLSAFDVSDLREAERGRAESEIRLRAVVENMPVLLDAVDERGRIIFWNRECELTTGYTAEEIVGNPRAFQMLYPDRAERERRLAGLRQRRGGFRDIEAVLTARDGSKRVVSWSDISHLVPVPGWARWSIGVDVTEQRRAERERERMVGQIRTLLRRVAEIEEHTSRRLAVELHDRVAQNLTAVGLSLNAVKAMLRAHEPSPAPRYLDEALSSLTEAMSEVRSIMVELRPPALEEWGLVAALRAHAQPLARASGAEIDVQGKETEPRLAASVELTLFRVAKEALMNAIKHASASRVHVRVHARRSSVAVTIHDNGTGFDVERFSDPQGLTGWGLIGMRERMETIGGTLLIRSRIGRGTTVIATTPRARS